MKSNEITIQETKTGQLTITIPRAIAAFKGWEKGTKLEIAEDCNGVVTLREAGVG